jgi:hypothetical protein
LLCEELSLRYDSALPYLVRRFDSANIGSYFFASSA